MVSEIYIENKRLDISADISSLLTFALDDIKDFSSRNTTFSKTIVLPGTANNNYLFGNIFNVKIANSLNASGDNVATNFNPAIAAECRMFQNRVQIFKGTLRVLEIIIENGIPEYEVAVFGELGGLVGALGANKLEDLDFSAYDAVWNASGVVASWTATKGTGAYYPLIDYGGVSALKVDYDLRAFRPAFYVREFIDKIITDAGYTWESELFDTDRFKALVIPNKEKALQVVTDRVGNFIISSSKTVLQNPSPNEAYFVPDSTALSSDFSYGAGVITYNGSDTKTFRLECAMFGNYHATDNDIVIGYKKNGSSFYATYLPLNGTTSDDPFSKTFPSVNVTLANGDTIGIYGFTGASGDYYLEVYDVVWRIFNPVPIPVDASPGDTIIMNDVLPRNVLQKDFLSSIVKLFNLYIYEDRFTSKKIYLEPYVDFYDLNPSGVVDWNYKIDRSKPIRIKPMSELNSRFYDFKFKEDSDYYNELYKKTYNETYGNRIYDSSFEFTNERSTIELIFSPTVLVGYSGVDKIVSVLYKKNAGVEEKTSTNIRILQSMNVTGVTSWSIKDGTNTLQSGLTTYGYAGHYNDPDAPANDIQFGVPQELYFTLLTGAVNVTQFNVYWSSYMAEIQDKDSKLMSAWIKLNTADIFDLDFSKLVFVDGSLWRLSKIEDWNASEPDVCKVELLKVINLLY